MPLSEPMSVSEVMTLSESVSESASEVEKNLVSVSEPKSEIEFFYLSESVSESMSELLSEPMSVSESVFYSSRCELGMSRIPKTFPQTLGLDIPALLILILRKIKSYHFEISRQDDSWAISKLAGDACLNRN